MTWTMTLNWCYLYEIFWQNVNYSGLFLPNSHCENEKKKNCYRWDRESYTRFWGDPEANQPGAMSSRDDNDRGVTETPQTGKWSGHACVRKKSCFIVNSGIIEGGGMKKFVGFCAWRWRGSSWSMGSEVNLLGFICGDVFFLGPWLFFRVGLVDYLSN